MGITSTKALVRKCGRYIEGRAVDICGWSRVVHEERSGQEGQRVVVGGINDVRLCMTSEDLRVYSE